MRINPATLPYSLHLQRDREDPVRCVQRMHLHETKSPHLSEVDRIKHAIRAARLGNWLTWLSRGFVFHPWQINHAFPSRPAHLADAPFPAKQRRGGPLPATAAPILLRYRELWPVGRKITPWRIRYLPFADPDVPSGEYTPGVRGPRTKRKPAPGELTPRQILSLIRTTPRRHDGAK